MVILKRRTDRSKGNGFGHCSPRKN